MTDTLDRQCIDTLRFLSVDMVQQANSGHPGCRSAPRRWPTCCGRAT
jgi:transketolase